MKRINNYRGKGQLCENVLLTSVVDCLHCPLFLSAIIINAVTMIIMMWCLSKCNDVEMNFYQI